ncbi:MAG: hypothetical protein GC159_18285 [Phycisphaera sp.]|nr:hypothetical protein [Phycisphaera sp.]
MADADVKSDLRNIADHLPPEATYSDAMYELYLRKKVADGRRAAAEGRTVSHEDVKRKFQR